MSERFYTHDHEWVRKEGDEAVIGITDYAQEQLGDLVFVELPEVGRKVSKGEAAIVVESVKAASDVYMPIGGEVTAVNQALENDPGLVNSAAEDGGWLVKLRMDDPAQLDGLLNRDAYRSLIDEGSNA